jgi:hypothetical protein
MVAGRTLPPLGLHRDRSGVATFSIAIKPAVPVGYVISATATSPSGNTSPFSADITVTKGSSSTVVKVTKATQVSVPVRAPLAVRESIATASDPPASGLADLVLGSPASPWETQADIILTELAVDQLQANGHRSASRT